MSLNDLTIDNYPKINEKSNTISTEYIINSNKEISISINNTQILDAEDIYEVLNNTITLISDINIKKKDNITVVYYKI